MDLEVVDVHEFQDCGAPVNNPIMTKRIWGKARALITNPSGAAAVEYALLASGVAITIAVAVTLTGNQLATLYNDIAAALVAGEGAPDEPDEPGKPKKEKKDKKDKKGKKSKKS